MKTLVRPATHRATPLHAEEERYLAHCQNIARIIAGATSTTGGRRDDDIQLYLELVGAEVTDAPTDKR